MSIRHTDRNSKAPPVPEPVLPALLIVGHGSTLNPDSSEPTLACADDIRTKGIFSDVVCAFWKEEPGFREARHMLETLDTRTVYIVPNFISEGYFTQKVIPREFELQGPSTVRGHQTWHYCPPVGSHHAITQLLLKRAAEVAPGVPPTETSLLIVGHGTSLNDNSAVAAKSEVERIAALGVYGEVLNTYMEEPPLIAEWDVHTKFPNVVVVPFFIADGLHSYQDIPVLLGIEEEPTPAASARNVFRENPHHLRNRTLYYSSAIGTEPGFAEVIVDQTRAFDREHRPE